MATIILDGETSYILRTELQKSEKVEPHNGTDFVYKELSKIVGGYIEIVFHLKENKDYIMVVNEEGQLQGLRVNEAASVIAGQTIVGDVLLCPRNMVK